MGVVDDEERRSGDGSQIGCFLRRHAGVERGEHHPAPGCRDPEGDDLGRYARPDDDSVTEPEAQRSYRECAEHYSFLIDPTPPRSPHLKGKVENGEVTEYRVTLEVTFILE